MAIPSFFELPYSIFADIKCGEIDKVDGLHQKDRIDVER